MTDQHSQFNQLCEISLETFINKSKQVKAKVVGTIRTLFKHKKYIIELYINRNLVLRAYKRYNEFEALHQLIAMKYKNYILEQMPSKFQLFNKEETRKEYFQNMLQKIIKDHQHVNPDRQRLEQTKRRMLSIVYLFLVSSQNQDSKILEKKKSTMHKRLTESDQFSEQQVKRNFTENFQEPKNIKKNSNNAKSECQNPIKIYKVQQKFPKQVKQVRKHRMSYEQQIGFNFQTRPRCNSLEKQFASSFNEAATQENQFEVKFEHQKGWKKRFIYIKNSEVQLFKNKLDNNFKTKIQLFRIKVQFYRRSPNIVDHFCEKMEFNVTRTFKQNPELLSLYHQHDYQKILIRKPLKSGEDPFYNRKILADLKNKFVDAANVSPINPEYDGVFNPMGKVFIFLHKIMLSWKKFSDDQTIKIKIKTGALSYHARPIVYGSQITLNQGFLIPISNSFEIIKFECYSVKDEGFVKDNVEQGKLMGTFSFTMTEFLTKPQGFLLPKVCIKLETEQSRAQKYQTYLQISLENFSDFSSVYSESFANQHDGKGLRPLKSIDDIQQLSLTVDRILRILGSIALFIQAFWRNVYLFKYPRMGYFFFSVILFNALFLETNDIVKEFFIIFLLVILNQQPHINMIIRQLMDKYVFSYQHPNFKNPMILSTSQVKYLKWSNQLQYITEEYIMVDGRLEKNNQKKRLIFQFIVHDRKFIVRDEEQSFFEKFKEAIKVIELVHKMIDTVANALQKIANLLSWYDPKRTMAVIFVILIFSGVASGYFVRMIVTLFCIHRFVKGLSFYHHKHYNNNRKFAVYCLNYILKKNFPQIISPKKHSSFKQLDQYLSDLVFPIHDEISAKKLKTEMDEIMGVYLDPQSLYGWAIKKNYLKIGILIDFVETCQSRLKLKWISGPQGISNDFQELKQQTKQIPVIDVWIQSLIINFIMNIPSQLYTKFWNDQATLTNMRKLKKIKEDFQHKNLNIKTTIISKKDNNNLSCKSDNNQKAENQKKLKKVV